MSMLAVVVYVNTKSCERIEQEHVYKNNNFIYYLKKSGSQSLDSESLWFDLQRCDWFKGDEHVILNPTRITRFGLISTDDLWL